jgi:hypothetical protein
MSVIYYNICGFSSVYDSQTGVKWGGWEITLLARIKAPR